MALSNGSINNGRARTKDIQKDLNEARKLVGDLRNYLSNNENYDKFVNGTDFGKNQNDKIQKIIGLLDQNLTAETTNLTAKLNSFFNRQEELNRRAAAAAAAARAASANSQISR